MDRPNYLHNFVVHTFLRWPFMALAAIAWLHLTQQAVYAPVSNQNIMCNLQWVVTPSVNASVMWLQQQA
jgi:hypothetical protein